MKDNLSTGQCITAIVSNNLGSSCINTLKFPEVMTLSVKIKIILIFVVMNGINAFYKKFPL